jgi:hypothetical protein
MLYIAHFTQTDSIRWLSCENCFFKRSVFDTDKPYLAPIDAFFMLLCHLSKVKLF